MIKVKKKVNLILLSIILVSYFVIPSIGIQLINSKHYNQDQNASLDIESFTSSLNLETSSNLRNQETTSSIISGKFDRDLNEFLTNLIRKPENNPIYINLIISFEESLNKEQRIDILDSVFDSYELKQNYDLISAAHVKINPNYLISNIEEIKGIKSIKEIHESRYYELPYIEEESLQLSALDSEDYSNWWLPAVGAENLTYDGSGVRVAVIDTGIYPHQDLTIINNRNFISEEDPADFDDLTGHGTHAAGIIAGDGSGSSGEYRGVAPGAFLINARAGNESGLAETDIISAIEWSSKPTSSGGAGADIVSMSFGGGYPYISDNITKAISNAKSVYGVIFVSSAGNSGPQYFTGSTPATGIDVIPVGATNRNNNLASFSSWGPTFGYIGYPDVVAPGVNIISTDAEGSTFSREQRYKNNFFDFTGDADYIPLSGTSFACPIVAGGIAILLEAYPNLSPEAARIALLEGAKPLSNEFDDDILKSGAGMMNITASLNYLAKLSTDYNDIAKFYPDILPVKPYDMLNFPGDHQKFNLTVISGDSNIFNIEIPNNIQGVSLSTDKSSVTFTEAGIAFVELEIVIEKNVFPRIKTFQINLTSGGQIYDIVDISLDIRLPEYRILMESYHGLNDWFADEYLGYTFYQLGFYDAMKDLADLNISIDYNMEYWSPDYNRDLNNSILTEEKLAQYDIVVMQNPILPYSSFEIDSLEKYFDNGGNLLFLGTRYQDMVVENINHLFTKLGADIQVNEENIMNDNWLGIGASISSQSVYNFSDSRIFKDVSQFYWSYGNSFSVSDNANSIATLNNYTVAALYDGTENNKGKILAFGDLHWMYTQYDSTSYSQDHYNLLKNTIDFLLPSEEVSINIDIGKERISNSGLELFIYMKNQTSEAPITNVDYTSLSVMIKNGVYQETIILDTTHASEGIYFNNSFNLPIPSYTPYTIIVDLAVGSTEINKSSKILYYNSNEMPKIIDISYNEDPITRDNNQLKLIITELDDSSYSTFNGYLSIYSYSFYNSKASVNKTLTLNHALNNDYIETFYTQEIDPSGFAIFYLTPMNSNYITSNSPRVLFQIQNNPPEILKESSFFDYDYFDDTESDEASFVYSVDQRESLDFAVDVRDTVAYEDDKSNMRVFVNLFITVVKDGSVSVIFPDVYEVAELVYQDNSNKYEGTFTIPKTIQYSTISGTNFVSTETDYDSSSNSGYLGVLFITAYDSEGGFDEFIIIVQISGTPMDLSLLVFIVLIVVGVIGFAGMLIYFVRRQKRPRVSQYRPRYQDYGYKPSIEKPEDKYITPEPSSRLGQFYCPFCGQFIAQPKKFCPNCGESLDDFL